MTANEVVSRLRREGWTSRPGKGAHLVFRKPSGGRVIVSMHKGDIPTGTLRSICRSAGWDWPPKP